MDKGVMGKDLDNLTGSRFHRGWIGLAMAAVAVMVVVLLSYGGWVGQQVDGNLQATGPT